MASEPPKQNVEVGRVLGRGFEALKANFLPFFGFALVLVGAPAFIGQYLMLSNMRVLDPRFFISSAYWGSLAISTFGVFLGGSVLQGVLTRSTILQLSGRDPDIGGSAMLALRLLLPILGISLCVGIMIGVGFICLIVPGIMIWCAFSVSVPALVEERAGVFGSITRSRNLTRGARFQVFLLGALIWILSVVIGGVLGAIGGAAGFGTGFIMPNPLYGGLSHGLASSLTQVMSTVFIASLYVELREVKEGARAGDLAEVFA